MAAKPVAPPTLDAEIAKVLLVRQGHVGALTEWAEISRWGLNRQDGYGGPTLRPILKRMLRWSWIEERATQGGHTRLAYRLTDAGRPFLDQAAAFLVADTAAREAQWRANQIVYGVARDNPTDPLTEIQARAWLRGYFEHLVRTAPVPADLPFEARHLFDEVRDRTADRLAPFNPFAKRA